MSHNSSKWKNMNSQAALNIFGEWKLDLRNLRKRQPFDLNDLKIWQGWDCRKCRKGQIEEITILIHSQIFHGHMRKIFHTVICMTEVSDPFRWAGLSGRPVSVGIESVSLFWLKIHFLEYLHCSTLILTCFQGYVFHILGELHWVVSSSPSGGKDNVRRTCRRWNIRILNVHSRISFFMAINLL